MKESKVFTVLRELDIYERNRLRKFLLSPYFNKNDKLTLLFEILDRSIKGEGTDNMEYTEVWSEIYPSQNYNSQRFRKSQSDLLKLIEEFFAQEQYQGNPLHKASYLLESINLRKISKLYNSTISRVRRLSEQQLERSASYYYYQYQIEKNLFELTSEFERKTKSKSALSNFNISEIAKNLDLFYLAEKMKYICTLHTWKNIINVDESMQLEDVVVKQVQSLKGDLIPPLAVYYQIYLSTTEPDEEDHYKKLKELIINYLQIFPLNEAKDIFEAALNYCIRKINKGNSAYGHELLELYEYGLNQKILIVRGEISPTTFRNICFIALRLSKFDWTENFIGNFSQYLNEKYQSNAVSFNYARLHWHKKEYDEVINNLREVEFDDMSYQLSSKAMLLACYYELDEIEALLSMCNSFSTFLNRHKKHLPEQRVKNYKSLIKVVKRMSKIMPNDEQAIQKLEGIVHKAGKISDRNWILEKIAELKGVPLPAI